MGSWSAADAFVAPATARSMKQFLAATFHGADELVFACIAGSTTVGLSHHFSDIDIYGVRADGAGRSTRHYAHEGSMVDLTILSAADVADLSELGSAFVTTGRDRRQILLPEKTLQTLTRLATGLELVGGEHESVRRIKAIDRDVVRKILMTRAATRCASFAEDAVGALAAGDWYTAVAASDLALQEACEALLAAAGDIYLGRKFLFRRLARTPATRPHVDLLWSLSQAAVANSAPPEAVRDVVERRLGTAGHYLAWALVEGWDGGPELATPPPSTAPAQRLGALRRNPAFSPIRFSDGIALAGLDRSFRVSEPLLRIWRLVDGRSAAALAESAPREDPRLSGLTGRQISTAIDQLLAKSLVVEDRPLPVA